MNPDDIQFDLVADITDHPVVAVRVMTPLGEMMIMAELSEVGSTLKMVGTHMHSNAKPNTFGHRVLMQVADVAMERMGYDEIVVEGAARTTGANPGRRPRPLRFTR